MDDIAMAVDKFFEKTKDLLPKEFKSFRKLMVTDLYLQPPFSRNNYLFIFLKEVNAMPYYKTCPNCGAHLDPCEPCDCTSQADNCVSGHTFKLKTTGEGAKEQLEYYKQLLFNDNEKIYIGVDFAPDQLEE